MAIKITIQSVSGADYFKFKEYPSEFFESKTKSYELYRNKNSNEDGNKILFSAKGAGLIVGNIYYNTTKGAMTKVT